MKILIIPSADGAVERTAALIAEQVRTVPASVLGFATGGTMPPVYDRLVQLREATGLSFSRAVSFNLDEYVGLSADHPLSYHTFMREHLFSRSDFDPANTHLPRGDADDPVAEADRYEALIAARGPVDLQLLGIGANGHIGFNEPTSSLGSRTRVKTLTAATRAANRRFCADGEEPPRFAITVGIQTILESRRCVLLATGKHKADAVAAMVEGPVSAICPASALQLHPATIVILDDAAASKLALRRYYFEVHPNGEEVPLA